MKQKNNAALIQPSSIASRFAVRHRTIIVFEGSLFAITESPPVAKQFGPSLDYVKNQLRLLTLWETGEIVGFVF